MFTAKHLSARQPRFLPCRFAVIVIAAEPQMVAQAEPLPLPYVHASHGQNVGLGASIRSLSQPCRSARSQPRGNWDDLLVLLARFQGFPG